MMIDSHVHFWSYDRNRDAWITDEMAALQRDFLPVDLEPLARRHGIDGVIAVQAGQSEEETRFLAELAGVHPFIRGVVGWVDLLDPRVEERLDHFARWPVIKGWRHIVQGEADDFLRRRDFQEGVRKLGARGYTYDVLIYAHQLEAAEAFVERLGGQRLILDHCAKPDIRGGAIDSWEKSMRALAGYPGVWCKLSGLLTEACWGGWKEDQFRPYLDVVFDAFGPDRLVFGSDWPVLLLSGDYGRWKNLLDAYLEPFEEEERRAVFGGNAGRFYGL